MGGWLLKYGGQDVLHRRGNGFGQPLKSASGTTRKIGNYTWGINTFDPTEASDPLDGASFRNWAINVPADKAIAKVEMLSTPMVWLGMPANPVVMLSYTGS